MADSVDFFVDPAKQKSEKRKKKAPIQDRIGAFFGGDKRDRTADLLNAIQALSQLSYTPK